MLPDNAAGASQDVALYFTDHLTITYMHEHFSVRFADRIGRRVAPCIGPQGVGLFTLAGEPVREIKAFVHPDSISFFEPKRGDLVEYTDGCKPWGLFDGDTSRPIRRIVEREGKAFFSPAAELRADMNREEWRPIESYADVYEVSNLGEVRRVGKGRGAVPGLLLKPWVGSDGYLMVILRNDGDDSKRPVHQLVAHAFLGPRPRLHHVNHIDGVKTHNWASNLEYLSPLQNYQHAAAIGNGHFKLMPQDIIAIRQQYAAGRKIAHIAKDFGVSAAHCSNIVHRKVWPVL